MATLRSLVDLAPDVRFRVDHVMVADRAMLRAFTWLGTRDGGAFEVAKIAVSELDATGRIRRIDQYELDQLDAARTRFETIRASPPSDQLRIPPNTATRT